MAEDVANGVAVLDFAPEDPWEGEVPLDLTPKVPAAQAKAPAATIPDLFDRNKVFVLRAKGRSGKTLVSRYIVETNAARGGRLAAVSLDPGGKTSLAQFVAGVRSPETGNPAEAARFLEALVRHVMKAKVSALVDTRAEGTEFSEVVRGVSDMYGRLRHAGAEVIGIYLLGDDPSDLKVLAADAADGLVPERVLLVHNYGLVDPTSDQRTAFGRVERHPVHVEAVKRGAVVVDMPRMVSETMRRVDGLGLHLMEAAGESSPLHPFDAGRVAHWLEAMDAAFNPVRTWISAC